MECNIYAQGDYLARNPTWHTEDSLWKAGKIISMLQGSGLGISSIVDVGCGPGLILQELCRNMDGITKAVGIDPSEEIIDKARKETQSDIVFHVGSYSEIPGYYDLALAIDVIEHIPNMYEALGTLAVHAEFALFHLPLEMTVLGTLRDGQSKSRSKVGHLHYFSRATALATLRDGGFEPIAVELTASTIELPSASRGVVTSLTNVVRRAIGMLSMETSAKIIGGYSLLVLCRSCSFQRLAEPVSKSLDS